MPFKRKRDWELPESAATDEKTYIDRRRILPGWGSAAPSSRRRRW